MTITVSGATGVADPTLAFGLTGVSDSSVAMPFLDLMKMSRALFASGANGSMTNDALQAGGYLDAHGWPTGIPPGMSSVGTVWDWAGSNTSPLAAASRAGVYVLTYGGEGTLQLGGDVKILSSEGGRIVFQNLHGGTMMVNITATDPGHSGNYVHDIAIVPQQYEALHDAGEMFNPEWLALIQDARELRFMDWMHTNDVTQGNWADRPHIDDVSWSSKAGVPVEVMVQLANQTGAEPWFNMPVKASAEYIRQFATYVKDHLNPDLKAHVEFANEAWNGSLKSYGVLNAMSKADWGVSAPYDYYAKLATQSALIWDDVFGADANARVDNVLGGQTANAGIATKILNAKIWAAQDPDHFVLPGSVFDSLAITTYFGASTMGHSDIRTELLNILKTSSPAEATAWLAAKLVDPTYDSSIPQIEKQWQANKAVADLFGLDLVAYEGGQHVLHSYGLTGIKAADLQTLTTFLSGFVRSSEMADLYHTLWVAWAKVSDGPFMQFGDVAASSSFGAWGLFSALGDNNPRAALLADLNAHATSWFGTHGGEPYQQGVILTAGDTGETLTGTDKDDFLIGGAGDDTILAGKGHDAVAGGKGQDTLVLSGAPGDYTLTAENNGYRLTGPGLSDYVRDIEMFKFDGSVTLTLDAMLSLNPIAGVRLTGTDGNDVLTSGGGNDNISAKLGNDNVSGGGGNDTLDGCAGNDTLTGGSGADSLIGGLGADSMSGGAGNDTYVVDSTTDVVFEASRAGLDEVQSSVSWTLGANVENLTLTGLTGTSGTGNFNDNVLTGNAGSNSLSGMEGNDTLLGGAGNDTLDGGAGADSMVGGLGNDTFVVDQTSDVVVENAGEGQDEVNASVSYTLGDNVEKLVLTGTDAIDGTGNAEANTLVGNAGANSLAGLAGDDTITAGDGADTLDGGAGVDSMTGGNGDDLYLVDATTDKVIEAVNGGTDTVQSSASFILTVNVENLVLVGSAAISGTGNALDNILTGNSAGDLLSGGGGADTVYGGDGNDTLNGGAGIDSLVGGAGNDVYIVDTKLDVLVESASGGTDLVQSSVSWTLAANFENLTLTGIFGLTGIGNAAANRIIGGTGADSLSGLAGNDTIFGGAGNDTIDGGTGLDSLIGGMGNDTYILNNAADVIIEGTNGGTDLVMASVSYTLSSQVENLILTGTGGLTGTGNSLNNQLTGNADANLLSGLGGDDTLLGGGGNDTLDGGAGVDALVGGMGNDLYIVDNAADKIIEGLGGGVDSVQSSVTYTLGLNVENLILTGTADIDGTGNDSANILTGNSGANALDGGFGADTLIGGAGNDTLIGGGMGADSMIGGTGDDLYIVDTVSDVLVEIMSQGIDTVQSSVTWTLAANFENLTLTGAFGLSGTGNGVANILIGNAGDNALSGLGGDDTIIGGAGNDTITGGAGADVITGGAGADVIVFNSFTSGADTIIGFNGLGGGAAEGDVLRFDGLETGTFVYRGSDAFTGGFDHSEARVVGNQVLIDLNGDATADITITLTGLTNAAQLTVDNFLFV